MVGSLGSPLFAIILREPPMNLCLLERTFFGILLATLETRPHPFFTITHRISYKGRGKIKQLILLLWIALGAVQPSQPYTGFPKYIKNQLFYKASKSARKGFKRPCCKGQGRLFRVTRKGAPAPCRSPNRREKEKKLHFFEH